MSGAGVLRRALSIPNARSPAELVALGVAAEASGWDGVFLWDHLQLFRGMRLPLVDPWVVLGGLAACTQRVRLGCLVTPVPRRRPWKLGKELITLDHLSDGRAVAGVGLGFPPEDEFAAFGEDADPRVRARRLDEGLAVLDQMFRGVPVAAAGVGAELLPPARQQPRPPVWVAALWPNRRPLERARRWDGIAPLGADGSPLTPDVLAEVLAATGRRDGWDVVAAAAPGVAPGAYADVGATWLVESRWPEGRWFEELLALAHAGPRGL
jgi:alkanesulfonate monooxygenase SsuD/methylene tetrahydromethanopterin reductase-like flavin-dependent oxidoreductase (luciferase family)